MRTRRLSYRMLWLLLLLVPGCVTIRPQPEASRPVLNWDDERLNVRVLERGEPAPYRCYALDEYTWEVWIALTREDFAP